MKKLITLLGWTVLCLPILTVISIMTYMAPAKVLIALCAFAILLGLMYLGFWLIDKGEKL